jgi:quercetin dioxygenase-like cupin family protein
MKPIDLKNWPAKEPVPGFHGRFVHTENTTIAYWDIEKGAVLPEHAHLHEQVVNLLEGSFDLTVEGKTHRLSPGAVFTIDPNAPHSGKAITPCRIIDVFYPVREDYK